MVITIRTLPEKGFHVLWHPVPGRWPDPDQILLDGGFQIQILGCLAHAEKQSGAKANRFHFILTKYYNI
jgi:hypothetical protein